LNGRKTLNRNGRLDAKIGDDFDYVLSEDIRLVHGQEWYNEFCIAFGEGTMALIPEGSAVYYYDYLRCADKVDRTLAE
jgi:hypothetical protein